MLQKYYSASEGMMTFGNYKNPPPEKLSTHPRKRSTIQIKDVYCVDNYDSQEMLIIQNDLSIPNNMCIIVTCNVLIYNFM